MLNMVSMWIGRERERGCINMRDDAVGSSDAIRAVSGPAENTGDFGGFGILRGCRVGMGRR